MGLTPEQKGSTTGGGSFTCPTCGCPHAEGTASDERAAIVAWLRRQAGQYADLDHLGLLRSAANDVEREAHRAR